MKELKKYIFPFIESDERDRPTVVGTGILLAVSTHRFVLTAAHVLDQQEDTSVYLPEGVIKQGALKKSKIIKTSIPEGGTRNDDKIDLGLFKLDEPEAEGFLRLGLDFIKVGQVDPDDRLILGKKYVFTGYPGSQSTVIFSRKEIIPLSVSANCVTKKPSEIGELGFLHPIHVVVEFDRKKMADEKGNRMTAPSPKGMSGGAVWTLNDNGDYNLVGVGIEDHSEDKKILVGTRIGAVIALLRLNYPETMPYLKESSIVEYIVEE